LQKFVLWHIRINREVENMSALFNELNTCDKIAVVSAFAALLQLFIVLVATWRPMRRSAKQRLKAYVPGFPDLFPVSSFDETHWPDPISPHETWGRRRPMIWFIGGVAAFPYPLAAGFEIPTVTGNPGSAPIVLFPNVPLNGTTWRRIFYCRGTHWHS